MLFSKYQLHGNQLKNRIVMPPMTRARAGTGNIATPLMAKYYAQRASAGLIISEGTQISQQGQGYAWTPGIYTNEQIKGWKKVTSQVHQSGGIIYAQLWHVGRVSHRSLQPGNSAPISSSAIKAEGVKVFIDPKMSGPEKGVGEMVQHSMPRAMTLEEIKSVVNEFRLAARNANIAGFDGVELHGANGYLINQFIDSEANKRCDSYGGTLQKRLRFLREVVNAVCKETPPEKIGVRLAPLTTLQGTIDNTPEVTYLAVASLLQALNVGYIHIAEADWEDAPIMPEGFKEALRLIYKGTIIYTGKYDLAKAQLALQNNWADLIGFGRPFIANPDLPSRLFKGLPLNIPQEDYFFGGNHIGYTDY
ncbi:alkene reductase [Alteromonas sp. MMG017]|uniref:alkene reductase n=1 Tax=Alteromonas sp. MMG017 TaxID=2822692 RepID=UPI001B3A2718|nr:alkene reductase [Alteromonas sp. MMG017]MBQ4830035.1 alkene reductase [Alteromonas sp. MMG017]